jgi:hypothetical protein
MFLKVYTNHFVVAYIFYLHTYVTLPWVIGLFPNMAIYSAEYKLAQCSVQLPRERGGAGWGGRRRGPIYGFRMGHTRMKKLLPSAFTSISNKKSKILSRATYCRSIT